MQVQATEKKTSFFFHFRFTYAILLQRKKINYV